MLTENICYLSLFCNLLLSTSPDLSSLLVMSWASAERRKSQSGDDGIVSLLKGPVS